MNRLRYIPATIGVHKRGVLLEPLRHGKGESNVLQSALSQGLPRWKGSLKWSELSSSLTPFTWYERPRRTHIVPKRRRHLRTKISQYPPRRQAVARKRQGTS